MCFIYKPVLCTRGHIKISWVKEAMRGKHLRYPGVDNPKEMLKRLSFRITLGPGVAEQSTGGLFASTLVLARV